MSELTLAPTAGPVVTPTAGAADNPSTSAQPPAWPTVLPVTHFFDDVADPRVVGRSKHLLTDVIMIVLCGLIANCKDFVHIYKLSVERYDWLRERLGLKLPNGLPSDDTLRRVFAILRPEALGHAVNRWTAAVFEQLGVTAEHLAIDGKAMRGSRTTGSDGVTSMVTVLSAWASGVNVCVGQTLVVEGSNEMACLPTLLDLLNLKGAVVTGDAGMCYPEVAAGVIDRGGDSVLSVKRNQPNLFEDVEATMQAAMAGEPPAVVEVPEATDADVVADADRSAESSDRGHGRVERRWAYVSNDLDGIRGRENWKGLKRVGCVVRQVLRNGKETTEVCYFIMSRAMSALSLLTYSRNHWSVENGQHRHLDVTFGEDAHRLLDRTAADNLTRMRKVALCLLQGMGGQESVSVKRLRAMASPEYLASVMGA